MQCRDNHGVSGHECNVECEQNEVFSIVESDTVVDPGAVMVHVTDATLTNGTVMSAFGFDCTAFVTFVQNLTIAQSK